MREKSRWDDVGWVGQRVSKNIYEEEEQLGGVMEGEDEEEWVERFA